MAKKKIKSQTREEARPHKKDHMRPQIVPKLNLQGLKTESLLKSSMRSSVKGDLGSASGTKVTSQRVAFAQNEVKPKIRGLASITTKTHYNESKRSPRARLLKNERNFPRNDNQDLSVYSGARKFVSTATAV